MRCCTLIFSVWAFMSAPSFARRDANRKYRGGVSRYAKVKNELMILCKSHPHEYVTTMFDYFKYRP